MPPQEKQLFPRPAPPKQEDGMMEMFGKAFSFAQNFMQGPGGVQGANSNPNAGQAQPFNPASIAQMLQMIPPQMLAQMPQMLAQIPQMQQMIPPQMQQMLAQIPQMQSFLAQASAPQVQIPIPQVPQTGMNGNGHSPSLEVDRKILSCLEQLSLTLSSTTKAQEMLLTQIIDSQKLLLEIQKNTQKNLDSSIMQIPEQLAKVFSEFDDRQKKWTEENTKAFQDVLNSSLRQFFK